MEPNKLENQFREKINTREIQPSANAWDRLDAMLSVADVTDNTKAKIERKSKYRWMYVAATLLGFILISTVFLFQTEEMIDAPTEKVVFEENRNSNPPVLEEIVTVSSTEKVVVNHVKSKANSTTQKTNKSFPSERVIEKSNEVVAENSNATIIENSSKINQKTEVKVNAASLLASVDRVNMPNKIELQNKTNIKVNSNELLTQVDNELELSFREKVQQSFNKKYREVKVAVTQRNLE
ncbi:MAG: hypothetical protein EOO46_22835 [Flavobacterium sp.]|nr:MAG: hypothetical protein EOO46_22835 [Flavobacterium sp.]